MIGVLPETRRIQRKDLGGQALKVDAGDELHDVGDKDLKDYSLKIDAIADSAAGEFVFVPMAKRNQILQVPALR